jgi:hypothetical protein
MAANSEARLWIKASPRGTRSGFAMLPDNAGGRVTVTVLPKPWSATAGVVHEVAHRAGSTTHVVLHETELAALRTTPSSIGALAVSLGEVARDQADLLGLSSPPNEAASSGARPVDPFGDLIDLMLMAERGRLTTSPLKFEGSFAPSLLRLLTHERLVQAVESLIFRARPRYAELTEELSMPRGRLSARSLLFSQATGTPRVESTFDELSMDTPLLRVVASALRVVASERLPRKIAVLRPGLQTRAVHLLRHLAAVTLIDREQALLVAERLWLSPLDRLWESVVDAAAPVLRGLAVVPTDTDERSEAILIQVSTEKFWEQCLQVALESAFGTVAVSRDAKTGEGVSVPAPWAPWIQAGTDAAVPAPETFPDFMFRAARRVVVADAKYKLGAGPTPNASDGYQLFAYSHLATLGGVKSDLAVVLYPIRAGARSSQSELERLRDRAYPLWLVRVPFPSRADLHTQASWNAYQGRLVGAIRDFSTEWVVRRNASSAVA